jgi:hypothetical protein
LVAADGGGEAVHFDDPVDTTACHQVLKPAGRRHCQKGTGRWGASSPMFHIE